MLGIITAQWLALGLLGLGALFILNLTSNSPYSDLPLSGRIILSSICVLIAATLLSTSQINFVLIKNLLLGKDLIVDRKLLLVATVGLVIILLNSLKNTYLGRESLTYSKYIFFGECLLQLGIFAVMIKKQIRRVF